MLREEMRCRSVFSLRGTFYERKRRLGHRYRDLARNRTSAVEVPEFEDDRWRDLLPARHQQPSGRGADLLLQDRTRNQFFNPALSYLGLFGVGVKGHQSLENLGLKFRLRIAR